MQYSTKAKARKESSFSSWHDKSFFIFHFSTESLDLYIGLVQNTGMPKALHSGFVGRITRRIKHTFVLEIISGTRPLLLSCKKTFDESPPHLGNLISTQQYIVSLFPEKGGSY